MARKASGRNRSASVLLLCSSDQPIPLHPHLQQVPIPTPSESITVRITDNCTRLPSQRSTFQVAIQRSPSYWQLRPWHTESGATILHPTHRFSSTYLYSVAMAIWGPIADQKTLSCHIVGNDSIHPPDPKEQNKYFGLFAYYYADVSHKPHSGFFLVYV